MVERGSLGVSLNVTWKCLHVFKNVYLKVKIDGLPIPQGRLVKGQYKPTCSDCAMYFFTFYLLYIIDTRACIMYEKILDNAMNDICETSHQKRRTNNMVKDNKCVK